MHQKKINDKQELTVITTHINADFDALASMLAAQKLYPGSLVVFPGSQEKNLRNFFIASLVYLFNMVDVSVIDFSSVKRLVLVDTKLSTRIGKLSDLLERSDVEIHIYDHHPNTPNDIKGHYENNRPTGATVTILIEIIKEKGIDITPDEATIMCMGIYEDTGSFTFSSTTEADFKAAAFLLGRGANLNIVSNLIAREINPEQVGILNDMIQAASDYNINGVEIVITNITTESYVPDFAFLVHKMVKMENIDAIFAIAQMGSKIYIVARSRIPEVDVNTIVTPLGGGGHPFASAATVRGKTPTQVEHQLVAILNKNVKSGRQAKDLMSSPPLTVPVDISCKEASSLLTRYNINALLTTENNNGKQSLAGYISRQIIEKALYHQLDQVPVSEYMTTELGSVSPDADIQEIQDKIIDHKQRILPVMSDGNIVGVITRTNLLNTLVNKRPNKNREFNLSANQTVHARTKNIVKFMKERLSPQILNILRSIGETATEIGCNAFVIGGFVRDLFLYRSNEDIDIVIEGNGIEFAKKFAQKAATRIHTYNKFGTAVIIFPDGFKIDVASARMEYYKFPAALPTVEMSSIKLDLFRRDFTINTLAIQLNPDKFGILIDFFSVQKDIKEKAIRILHNLSFVEDPTRAFRAIRFEQRFGFTIGKLTSGLIKNAVKMDFFSRLSGRRIFSELCQILEEDDPTPAIIRLNDYNLLKTIHPSIELNNQLVALFGSTQKVVTWHDLLFLDESYLKWAVYFMALIRGFNKELSIEICSRLELAQRYKTIFCKERFKAENCLALLEGNRNLTNSDLYKQLSVFRTELILYMMAVTRFENIKKSISHFFIRLRYINIEVSGKDLIMLGLKPGPVFRETLEAVLHAKLNGRLITRQDELEFMKAYVYNKLKPSKNSN